MQSERPGFDLGVNYHDARSPTIHDVAKLAQVGVGTVSRVINGSAHVTDTKRQRVIDAIAMLHYEPNTQARMLGRRRRRGGVA